MFFGRSVLFVMLVNFYILFAKRKFDKDRVRAGSDRARDRGTEGGYNDIPLGAIFDSNGGEVPRVFAYGLGNYSQHLGPGANFRAFADMINTADAYKLSRLMCYHFERGTWMMYGAVSPDSFGILHAISNSYQVPFITPWFTHKPRKEGDGREYAISLRPDYHKAIVETIEHYGWKSIVYVYDSDDGLYRLQDIFSSLQSASAPFQISYAKRVEKVSDLIELLYSLEKKDRFSEKNIVLDSTQSLARFALVYHARDIELSRHNYKYFLTGLVLDGTWEQNMIEFGAINVVGFKLLDKTTVAYNEFLKQWKYGEVSAEGALAYDAAKVLVHAIKLFMDAGYEVQRPDPPKMIQCDPHNKSFHVFDYGDKMLKIVKQVEFDGITGRVHFDADGRRLNFTLQVVQMQAKGQFTKVGVWYDYKGLVPETPKLSRLNISGLIDKSKTYIVTTILEAPYYMERMSEYPRGGIVRSGFCSQLTEMIAQKLDMKYEMRLVRDESYGNKNSSLVGGWDGMIGELVRKEVDLAVAPLTVTRARAKVVDFSQPFLAFELRTLVKERLHHISLLFLPMSVGVWVSLVISFTLVGLVLYATAKLSLYKWRAPAGMEQEQSDDNSVALHAFSIWNAWWYTLKTLLRQGAYDIPKFLSGKIVGITWKIFIFFVVSLYTANLASILIAKLVEDMLRRNSDNVCGVYSGLTGIKIAPQDKALNNLGWFRSLILEENADILVERPCEMVISPDYYGVKEFAVAVVKNSDLREAVDLAITSLKENGELQKLINVWFSVADCYKEISKDIREPELTLMDMAGAFSVLGGGLIAAVIVALIELCHRWQCQNTIVTIPHVPQNIQSEDAPSPQHSATCSRAQLRRNTNRRHDSQVNSQSIQMTDEEMDLHETLSIALGDPRWVTRDRRSNLNSIELHEL